MHADYWHQRWQDGRTGFHREEPLPLLVRHWPQLELAPGSRVLVPLAGKSQDMLWLAEQGYRVLGVEISALAVEQFFSENGLQADTHASPLGTHHVADNIELIQGDVLGLDDGLLARCDAVYDRAAVIALPPEMRTRYVQAVYRRLPAGCRGLMITLEYAQAEMAGPPFSVDADEVAALLAGDWRVEHAERRDILEGQPAFVEAGLTALHTSVYRLERGSSEAWPQPE